jgi:hypothetical protein
VPFVRVLAFVFRFAVAAAWKAGARSQVRRGTDTKTGEITWPQEKKTSPSQISNKGAQGKGKGRKAAAELGCPIRADGTSAGAVPSVACWQKLCSACWLSAEVDIATRWELGWQAADGNGNAVIDPRPPTGTTKIHDDQGAHCDTSRI